ncbi:SGNH/GDSL hydrolase family protein [Listeria booriae]|uniref:SGNH/GDSL hydrolase family protein n=1 Tax=Listeria booriae TaxID=1552123 RepID=UPI0016294214|nr:hypothetical protein [Listeria booriae]MBC2168523.1 hypothetical protein [Listeria booriae]MBC2172633.1 hypothetical protein [Listeria booriae]
MTRQQNTQKKKQNSTKWLLIGLVLIIIAAGGYYFWNAHHSTSDGSGNSIAKRDISYDKTVAIGDSIMIDVEGDLESAIPDVKVDGEVGRQLKAAIPLADEYKSYNKKGSAVILELGTNGSFSKESLEELLNKFDKADIYVVNVRVPRDWEKQVNDILAETVPQYKNATLVDWYSLASKHSGYFGDDGVHLTEAGTTAWVNLVTEKMAK